jgi:hypothetical protein
MDPPLAVISTPFPSIQKVLQPFLGFLMSLFLKITGQLFSKISIKAGIGMPAVSS